MAKTLFLDLTETGVSVYSMKRNGNGWTAEKQANTFAGEDFTIALDKKFSTDESFLSLPLSYLNFRVLELPFSDPKKIRELLPFEIEGMILGSPSDYVFDTHILGESDGKTRILVVFISKERLGAILKGFRKSGFDPRVVTSVELSNAISSGNGKEFMELLVNSGSVPEAERANAATFEMDHPSLNLRRDEFAYTADDEKAGRALKTSLLLVVLLLAIFLSDSLTTIVALKKENQSLRDDIRKTYMGMFPQDKKVTDELYQAKAHLKELKEKESAFVGISPLRFLLDLSRTTGPDAAFSEINMSGDLIILKGECPSLTDAERIRNELRGFLEDVNISDAKQSVRNRTAFTITAKGRRG